MAHSAFVVDGGAGASGSGLRFDVVALGETMGQFVPIGGGIRSARIFSLEHAGAESNVAVGTARLGLRSAWASRLGADAVGERILAGLAGEGVDTRLVAHDPDRATGIFLKDPSGLTRTVSYYRRGSAASSIDRTDVDRVLEEPPRLLHLSGITPALSPSCDDAVEYALCTARAAGVTTSFDINFRPALWADRRQAARRLAELAGLADIVFVGLDEAQALWQSATDEAAAARLGVRGRLVVKDGGRAASAHGDGISHRVPALRVDVVESVGAGDAFAAGWLAALLHGRDDVTRLRCGHLMARRALESLHDHGEPIAWRELLSAADDRALWSTDHTERSRSVDNAAK